MRLNFAPTGDRELFQKFALARRQRSRHVDRHVDPLVPSPSAGALRDPLAFQSQNRPESSPT